MIELTGWFGRIERERKRLRMSVEDLLKELEISRATYYQYKSDRDRHPRDKRTIQRIANFLGEDPAALATEMAPSPGPTFTALFEAAVARELNTQLYQQHVRALAHVLGMGIEPRPQGVDVVVRLLRENLPKGSGPVDAAVVVVPMRRGRVAKADDVSHAGNDVLKPTPPYQYQIYVIPKALARFPAATATPQAEALLRHTAEKVNAIMDGSMLPVTREHSTELALPLFRGRADMLLYPGLLEMRPPDSAPRRLRYAEILVLGVYYGGAPDVAALAAGELRYGFSTFDHLARLQTRAGLRGLPSDHLRLATASVAHAVLAKQSLPSGPMIWAADDPDAVLAPQNEPYLRTFPGPIVLLLLSDGVLDYAAYRLGCVDHSCPDQEAQSRNREKLKKQQEKLLDAVVHRDPSKRTIIRTIELPPDVNREPDGSYRDAVDEMFDQYELAFLDIMGEFGDD